MILPITPNPAPLPEALAIILKNPDKNASYKPSVKLKQQIAQAQAEAGRQLESVSHERLNQIIGRLMLHYTCPATQRIDCIADNYARMLACFPEDLLCMAYQHVLKHHPHTTLPATADLIAIMEPEYMRRRTIQHQLDILLCNMEACA